MAISSSIWLQFWNNLNKIIESPTEYITMEEFNIINTTVCLANHLDIILIDENYQLLPNVNIERLLYKIITFVLNHHDSSTIEILLSICGSLVCLKECLLFSKNDAQTLIAIISLPWIDSSNSVFKNLPSYKYLSIIKKTYSTLLGK